MMTAAIVEIDVSMTDKAALALAKWTAKLETFPPGQAAINTIPKAILAGGLKKRARRIVRIGNSNNCEIRPMIAILGC